MSRNVTTSILPSYTSEGPGTGLETTVDLNVWKERGNQERDSPIHKLLHHSWPHPIISLYLLLSSSDCSSTLSKISSATKGRGAGRAFLTLVVDGSLSKHTSWSFSPHTRLLEFGDFRFTLRGRFLCACRCVAYVVYTKMGRRHTVYCSVFTIFLETVSY